MRAAALKRSEPDFTSGEATERGAGRAAAEGYAMIDDPEILAEPVKPEAAIEFWKQRARLTWGGGQGPCQMARKPGLLCVTGLLPAGFGQSGQRRPAKGS